MSVKALVCFADFEVRSQIRRTLEGQTSAIVAEADEQHSAAIQIISDRVDVTIVDARFIEDSECTLTDTCLAQSVPILAVVGSVERLDPADLLDQSVHGVIAADWRPDELIQAVVATASGALYISAPFAAAVVNATVSSRLIATTRRAALNTLTSREREVFDQIVQGRSNAQVAHELTISVGTVRFHVSNILSKLGRSSRSELIAFAFHGRTLRT